ncbi:MAG: hypothetical protein WD598_07855 [Acidimicrobiia bacterium]
MLRTARKNSLRHLLVVTLVAGGLGFGALGAPAHAQVPVTIDACTLVTEPDLQATLGIAFPEEIKREWSDHGGGTIRGPAEGSAFCEYTQLSPTTVFSIEVSQTETVKAAKLDLKRFRNNGAIVKGVGNRAKYATVFGDMFKFRQGKTLVFLRLVAFGPDATLQLKGVDVMTALGKVAVANL